ncbi:WYL domain-containing protein [Nocardioides panacisoli]|uniref:helix-turn-helix transcriptional regulator n=1 Tax=Nocardioides panacisoli TaxID=627624 RepID=UPI001C626511|nr:WYL domain-containing protein [Nocardioides panacisoli]QYJ04298.1 WYL domain-containing protein [Nocardioides panacisoli]
MERLVRIAAVLRANGDVGVPGARLAEVAGFSGDGAMDQLARDIRHLTARGWQIENVAGRGEAARYRMRAIDNRLRVRLTPPQLRAVQRAALLADRGDLVERLGLAGAAAPDAPDVSAGLPTSQYDERLDAVLRAVRLRSVLRFDYNGRARAVHPESVRTQNGKWYLRGQEDGTADGLVKAFVVGRMGEVDVDDPGTARRVPAPRHVGLHPMTWEIDPPVDVTLRTSPDYEPDVHRWLGPPAGTQTADGEVVLRYRVTNRAALRARLYELGRRVVLEGPEEIRRDVVADLEERADLR